MSFPLSILLLPAALLALSAPHAGAQLTWSLAGGSASWPADKRDAIVAAMNEAVGIYNANGYFPKQLTANYNASVPTAQASYSGWIDFGGSIGTRVALHEISHTLGVGQVTAWNTNRSGNTWTGTYANNRVKLFDGPSATLSADTMHFWPYGLNYDTEDGTTARVRHIKIVSAMRRDMGIVADSDNDGLPDDWELFYFNNLSQTASGDPNANGIDNLTEYNNDTNPGNGIVEPQNSIIGPSLFYNTSGTAAANTAAGYNYAYNDAGTMSAFTGATVSSWDAASGSLPNNAAVNYDITGGVGDRGFEITGNTLRIVSSIASSITFQTGTNNGAIVRTNGILNAGAGTLSLGKNDSNNSIIVGSNLELFLAAMAGDINIDGRILNNGAAGDTTNTSGIASAITIMGGSGRTVSFNGGNSTQTLDMTTVNSGTLVINRTSTASSINSGGLTINGEGKVQYGSSAGTNQIVDTAAITINGGTLDLNTKSDTVGTVTLKSGSITGISGVLASASEFNVEAGVISAILGGSGALTKTAPGTLTISAANTFTGNINIGGGNLVINNSNALGIGPKTVNINASADKFLDLDTNVSGGSDILLASNINFNTSGINGVFRNFSGNNRINGSLTMTSGNGNTRIISEGGSLTLAGNVSANTGSRVLDLSGSSLADNTFSGALGNTSTPSLIKSGTGKWILTGTNTYVGSTTISGGTLVLGATGSFAASPSLTIAAGAKLDTTAKPTFTPPTALTIGIDGVSATSGLINATGQELAIGAANLTFTISGTLTAPAYVIANYATLNGTSFLSVAPPDGYTLDYTYNDGPQIALVQIPADDYTAWAGPSGFNLTGGPSVDDDGDGLTNFKEYAFGLNPNGSSSVTPITNPLNKTTGKFSYTRRATPAATGLTYTVWTSVDLVTWTLDSTATSSQTVTGTVGEVQTVEATLPGTLPLTQSKLFIQVRAQ